KNQGRSRQIGGTGLGLSIVKHIAQVHGGRVEVASIPGSGTTFSLLLKA
ncbi:MAG: ATP-binding protein, partial [bacterium]